MELLDQLQSALGGTYTFERELGGGGMSRVFLATDRQLNRRVVVKVLSPEVAAEVSAKRFEREIRLAASLQQANIVPVLAAGSVDDIAWYTMPFVEGLSLRDRVTRDGPPPLAESIGILRDIARALAFAHERGVVHRDIKPENVLLSGAAATVTDFGIAKAISASRDSQGMTQHTSTTVTRSGTAVGTPTYMSPEQITGDPGIDHRTDLYSFGCVAYELFAGRVPFADRTAPQLFAAHLTGTPVPLGELSPSCPPALVRLVMQCLQKDPADRPQSAGEILHVLDTMVMSTSAFTRLRNRLTRRQRVMAGGVGAVALVVLVGLFVRSARGPGSLAMTTSLGVLPFVNVGGDSTRDVWADGLTDEITTTLAQPQDIRLATRTSVDRYRGRSKLDVPAVGRTLQVGYILHGTVWPQGEQVRVQAWLSRTADGSDVWSHTFDLGTHDILATLDSVTSSVREAVRRGILGRSAPLIASAPGTLRGTSDTAAYQLYLSGEVLLHARGNGVLRAAQLFEQAIAADPNFARAHAALSAALAILPNFADTTNAELEAQTTAAARKALRLDPTLAEAETSLALVSMHQYRWTEADSEFQAAIRMDSSDAYTYMHYGRMLLYAGRLADAVPEFERAKALDPTSPVIGGWLAEVYRMNGRRAEAKAEIERALELDSTSVPIADMGANVALELGQQKRARALAEIAWRPNGVPRPAPWPAAAIGIYAKLGDTATVRLIAQYVDSSEQSRAFGHSSKAIVALAQHDTARALDELEAATDAGEFWPSGPWPDNAALDQVRGSRRFADLLRRVNLDVARLTTPRSARPQ